MPEVLTLGEALIDFVSREPGVPLSEVWTFNKRFGGAPANVAIGLATLGRDAGFIGKVGMDSFGDFLETKFRSTGVNVEGLYRTRRANTTLAFVSLTKTGARDFIFYRNPGADELLKPDEIDCDLFSKTKVFHFGSLSLTNSASRQATLKALECAKKHEVIVTMDPNIRLSLWKDPSVLKKLVKDLLGEVDILKLNEEEIQFLSGQTSVSGGTKKLVNLGPALVIATLGKQGCFFRNKNSTGTVKSFNVESQDTTGAGDAFMAGFIHKLLEFGKPLPLYENKALTAGLQFASAIGAITTTSYGATSAFPDLTTVKELLAKQTD